ncbi:MAG: hypothetical protein ACRCVJ_06890 [Clostridium sp.]|uniref:hypothetical protein n=1 Tax=Clostridium sp. TaxID=1506 RepID=UPI003F3A611B
MKEYNDLKIYGDGVVCKGTYNNIKIAGSGRIVDDISTKLLKISGSCKSEKSIEANEIKIYGSFISDGEITSSDLFSINGSARVLKGNFKNNTIVRGELSVKEDSSFENIEVMGELRVDGSFEGTSFYGCGSINIDNLLSADNVEIITYRNCNIKEIGGEKISIKNNDSKRILTRIFNPYSRGNVMCECIEGDTILLENTICKVVRGESITIGKGCKIDRVEYSNELTIDDKSIVREKICMKN